VAELPTAAAVVVKAAEEQRYTLAVAYPADKLDLHGEYMSARDLEQSAWDYVAKHRSVGLWHAEGTEGHGTVVESYIYRGPDWTLTGADGSSVVVKAGDWMLGVQWDVPAWAEIKKGRIDGMSMQGRAIRVPTPDAAVAA
jgi:hypothetical protein